MRSSYFLYALKKLKEGQFTVLAKQAYKFATLPLSYYLNRPISGPIHGVFVVNYDCNLKCGMCDLMHRPEEYKKKGNKETREAIAAGAKVVKDADGKITIEKPAPTQMGLKHFTTKERIH